MMKFVLYIALALAASFNADAATNNYYRGGTELHESVDDLQHELENHEAEIRVLEERLINQEVIMEAFREQLLEENLANKELVQGNAATIENRMVGLETMLKEVVTDLRKLQTHANDSAKVLEQYKKKIQGLNKNNETLQAAIHSMMEALQLNTSQITKTYCVQAGDSLEKIARRNKTSVKALKKENSLKNDKIIVGQTLKLP